MTQPSPSVRRFRLWIIATTFLLRIARGFDASDLLTVIALVGLGLGIELLANLGLALTIVSALILVCTPIGTAVRVTIRGK